MTPLTIWTGTEGPDGAGQVEVRGVPVRYLVDHDGRIAGASWQSVVPLMDGQSAADVAIEVATHCNVGES